MKSTSQVKSSSLSSIDEYDYDYDYDDDDRNPMLCAVRRGDTETINALITTGTDLNALFKVKRRLVTDRTTTYLNEAVLSRQAESVQALLSGGADINMRQHNGMSSLHVASDEGFTDIVRTLLDNGADIESKDKYGCTPLFNAAVKGHIHVVRLLIGDCAGVNMQMNDEPSAITADSSTAQFGIESLHAYRRADVEAEDYERRRPFHSAVMAGRVELFELLIQHGANVDAADKHGNRPLHAAVDHGLDVVQLLVQHGAKLNVQNNDGKTPLHIAVQWKQPEVIMFMLSQDADAGLTDVWRNTPLHYFTSELSEMIRGKGFGEYLTKLLIKKHQHLLGRNVFGMSAITQLLAQETTLRNAIYVRCEKFVAKPLPYVDGNGNTPLHRAVGTYRLKRGTSFYHFDTEFLEFLLKRGADINAQNNDGLTPLHLALSAADEEFLELSDGKVIETCLHYANDQSFTITDNRGRNFWHLLFIFGSVLTIETVLGSRLRQLCKVSSAHNVDDLNRTPLHYAYMRDDTWLYYLNFVKTMISDEHINIQDKYGRTALHYAAMGDNTDSAREFLVTKMNDTIIQDVFGYTHIDYQTIKRQYYDSELLMSSHYIYESWVRETFAAKCNESVQCTTHQLTQIFSELRKGNDSASSLRNSYLGCRLDYAFIGRTQKPFLFKECVYKRRLTETGTRSTDMYAAIGNCVTRAMEYLASEISARDSRFSCEVVAVGSASEGTKIGRCDEFDYNFVLTDLSRMCKVCYSPESPSGFVLLKASTSEYDEDLFNCNGTLDTRAVKFKFVTLVNELASSLGFCEVTGFEPVSEAERSTLPDQKLLTRAQTCIKLLLTQPVDEIHVLHEISVDIVPALQINDWWPDDARRQDLCQTGDCLIVFSQPQKKYPWVGWTEPHGFISFARAESRLLRKSPKVVKAAYMVAKRMSKYFRQYNFFSSHVIKTALLWCLDEEGFSNCSSSSNDSDEVNEDELLRLVQNILRRLLCFAAQDYVPCYFMPKCHQPVWPDEIYFKQFHIELYQHGLTHKDLFNLTEEQLRGMELDDIHDTFIYSHLMYWSVLSDNDELKLFVPSTINPLREISYESDIQS